MSDIRDLKLLDLEDAKVIKKYIDDKAGTSATSALHTVALDSTAHQIKFYTQDSTAVQSTTPAAFTVDIKDIYDEVGKMSTVTINGTATTVVADAVAALDKEIGILTGLTVNGATATAVVDAIKALDAKVDGATTITVKAADGTATTSVVKAINRLDAEVGDAKVSVETAKGTTASDITAAINQLDKEVGNIYDLEVESASGTTASDVVTALNALNKKAGEQSTAMKVLYTKTAGTTADIFANRYTLFQGTTAAADKIVDIDIPKDFMLKDAEIKTCTVADQPISGLKVGDKYFDFEVNVDDEQQTTKHVYLAAKDLVEDFTVEQNAKEVQLTIDTTSGRELKAALVAAGVDTTAIKDLAITTGKLSSAAVTAEKISTGAVTSAAMGSNAIVSVKTGAATTADYDTLTVSALDDDIVAALNKAYSALQTTSLQVCSTAEIATIFA